MSVKKEEVHAPSIPALEQGDGKLSVNMCRKILGKKSEKCTDQEIEQTRNELYVIAEILIERFLEKNKNNN